MATQVTVITGEGSTTYSVSTGARGPAGPAGTGGGGSTPAGSTLGQVQLRNSDGTALAADSGLVYTGTGNTGVLKIGGGSVIMSDPTVSQNVAIGGGNPTLPFANRTSGNYNTVVGTNCLPLLTTGSGNVAIGTSTLSALLGGNNNVGVGVNALTAVTSGSGNVSIGNGAGAYITTGFDNICIGGGNPVENTNFSSISIGSTGDGNSTTVIGIAGGTATTQTRLVGNTLILGHASTTTSRTSLVQSASASAKTITLPNATGTVPVYTNAAALGKVLTATDNTGVATWETPTTGAADTTVIDGSTNAVSGNAVFDALALKAPTASPTLSGTVTATGQISSSGSTDATVSTNVVNVATNDARYYPQKIAVNSSAETVTNSATLTASTQSVITLGIGTYYVEVLQLVSGSNATGGSNASMSFTGSATAQGVVVDRGFTTNVSLANTSPTYDGGSYAWNSSVAANFSSNVGVIVIRKFIFIVTSAGDLATTYAQATATVGQSASLKIGSNIKTTKIA